jgi:hypothetical protein
VLFLFVLVEQSFQTWTPTFYKEILKVPTSMSIQAGAVLAGLCTGKIFIGFFSKNSAGFMWFLFVWLVLRKYFIGASINSHIHIDAGTTG